MELFAGAVVVILLLWILGIDINVIISGVVIILFAAAVLTHLFFLVSVIGLIASKKREAYFSRFDRRGKAKWETAFYEVGDTELPNIFPCEVVMRDKLYRPDRKVKVRLSFSGKVVYDRNAVATIIFGNILCIPLTGFFVFVFYLYSAGILH